MRPFPHLSPLSPAHLSESKATDLSRQYGYTARPSSLLNSIFMSTVNKAAEMLVSVASSSKAENPKRKPTDHLRFMVMLMTWLMVWILRFLMDHFPCSFGSSQDYLLGGFSSVSSFQLALYSSTAAADQTSPSLGSSLDLILHDGVDGPSLKSLERALTHVSLQLHIHHPEP
ncbi:hypothetical protein DITRI_Ditri01bG0104000 [Diplodiscus trichospermus]